MTAAMLGTAVSAQETYDNAQLATKDLNGTARYVGMGGAMEALGADYQLSAPTLPALVCSVAAWWQARLASTVSRMPSRLAMPTRQT